MDLKFKIGSTNAINNTEIENGSILFDKKGKIHLDIDN